MDCCGRKRREWLKEINSLPTESIASENTQERESKLFEYTGKHSLRIKGIITGNIFYFRFPGHKIEVPYEDSFAMMAETDLKLYAKYDNRSI